MEFAISFFLIFRIQAFGTLKYNTVKIFIVEMKSL